jgi:hypothetical protein
MTPQEQFNLVSSDSAFAKTFERTGSVKASITAAMSARSQIPTRLQAEMIAGANGNAPLVGRAKMTTTDGRLATTGKLKGQ